MMPDEELESRKQPFEDQPCRNCGHGDWYHRDILRYEPNPCEALIDNDNHRDFKMCGCLKYEPADAEDILEQEGKI